MKLCTFEVATHLGRHSRAGIVRGGRIIDVNFAAAWQLAERGEADPQPLANAVAPANLLDFLRAGARALRTAEELFQTDWWKGDAPPRGPNDETLVYKPEEIRFRSPVPAAGRTGSGDEIACDGGPRCAWKMAAVIGKPGANVASSDALTHVAGFTALLEFGDGRSAMGPYLVTPNSVKDHYDLETAARINGEVYRTTTSGTLRPHFELAIELMSRTQGIRPGDVIAIPFDLQLPIYAGDVLELEIGNLGTLKSTVV